MKTRSPIPLLLSMFGFASIAAAESWAPYSAAELVYHSDLVVIGVMTPEGGGLKVQVSEVLKGEKTEQLRLETAEVGMGDVVIPAGEKGIMFLRVKAGSYAPFHPACFKSMNEQVLIRTVVDMFTDPAPHMKEPKNEHMPFVLGKLFSAWRITSPEIPSLGKAMAVFAERPYEAAPWAEKGAVTLECETSPGGGVKILSAQPAGPLADFARQRLLTASMWPNVKPLLKPRFTVVMDARVPEKAVSATQAEALTYLRSMLKSTHPPIVLAALLALAEMRDLNAVPHLLPLLQHENQWIQISAIEFLGWSRSPLAAKPLADLLDAKSGWYPKFHEISDSAALALKHIGNPESLPSLERAASHGVRRAIEVLGAIGTADTFAVLLKSAAGNPRTHAYMTNAFYWLVRRSNKKLEDWMSNATWSADIGAAKIPKWVAWWEANGQDFKVVKSQEEALAEAATGQP